LKLSARFRRCWDRASSGARAGSLPHRPTVIAILLAITLTLLLGATGAVANDAGGQWRFSGVERVVAVGDVHGAYPELVEVLQEAGLISADRVWSGGAAHLVMLGDIVDRGPQSREALTLVMRLQAEARHAGGQVHVVLGNHEVMNLVGDLRYVSPEEFAAYQDGEDPKARKHAFKQTLRALAAANPDLRQVHRDFDRRCPPGYFGHRQAFSPDGLYGRWLLGQQIVVVINDVVFVHGGLAPVLLDLEPDQINGLAMGQLRGFVTAQQRLISLGVLGPQMTFAEQIATVQPLAYGKAAASAAEPDETIRLARTMVELGGGLVFRPDGPLWYRGTSLNPESEERSLVHDLLAHLGAASVVVGHTTSHTTRLMTRFDGEVVMADTGMLASHYDGRPSAVEIRNGQLFAIYPGEGSRPLQAQRWEFTADRFAGDADIEEFLRTAQVVWKEAVGSGSTRPVQIGLAGDGRRAKAVFKTIDTDGRRYVHEVAAYKLDRLLGLGMVPTTVLRAIDGTPGSVQLWVENAVNENNRRAENLQPDDLEAFESSVAAAKVFDLVIFNIDRNGSNTLITPIDWRLHLIDNERAFAAKSPASAHLKDARSGLDESLEQRLAALDRDALHAELSGLLSEDEIAALLARVDLLLPHS
jgi:hypothetical protein